MRDILVPRKWRGMVDVRDQRDEGVKRYNRLRHDPGPLVRLNAERTFLVDFKHTQ